MFRKTLALAILLAFVTPLAAQVTEKKDPKEEAETLRKEAIAFLRETMGDVANMRTLENRISFSAEMAGLMWYHDEREARVMFNAAAADFRELLSRLEHQMNELPDDADGSPMMGGFLMGGMSDQTRLMMKYRVAMGVRQQMATAMADHDPDLALGFYYDTASANPKIQSTYGGRDANFESTLIQQIADKNPGKAVQLGLRSLENGVQNQHIELLRKIYAKDTDKGIEFGSAVLSKARDNKAKAYDLYVLNALLNYGAESLDHSKTNGKRPVYSQQDLRDIAESMAQSILTMDGAEMAGGAGYVTSIQRFAPARAAQVKARISRETGMSNSAFGNYAANGANTAVNARSARRGSSNSMVNADFDADDDTPPPPSEPTESDRLDSEIKNLAKGELPKEERDRAIAQARKMLLQTKGRDKQIVGLSMLATQVAKAGDKELAAEIMRDAEKLVNPNPKNYQDFLFTWMLATGYAESNPDKAFPILEDAIGRANNVISAFVQVGEFIDVTEEMISDGEAQVGAFGGGMIRGLSKELGIAEATIDVLVKADFAKTKGLTNRFERPEVRVLAKMLVLRSVLGKKDAPVATPAEAYVLK